MRSVRLPGRFQVVPGEVEWILDVAHNVPAARGAARQSARACRRARTIAVCGILGDKDVAGIAAALGAEIDAWVLVALDGPRAVSHRASSRQRLPRGARSRACAGRRGGAAAWRAPPRRPGDRILVFGSFLTVGPALEFLGI